MSAGREKTRDDDAADDEVCRHASSPNKNSSRAATVGESKRSKAEDIAGEYSMASVDGSRRGSDKGTYITGDIDTDAG